MVLGWKILDGFGWTWMEFLLLLDGANKLKLLSMWAEESGDGYEATIELTFKDEDVDGLRQVVDFIQELAQFEIKRQARWLEESDKYSDSNGSEAAF